MARYRLSGPAQADLANILAASLERWGREGRSRYQALLAAAMRTIASDPEGPLTRDRAEILPGIRSLHTRHAHGRHGVSHPVHVVFYRHAPSGAIEVVRVLHERMEPSRHLPARARSARRGRGARRRL
jgi:toxin ParE1/3/4